MADGAAFRAPIVAIALYVIDDVFVHPERGVAAGDHVVSGLVPLAILLTLALAYPRLRPGARGALSIVLGALAIAAGATDGVRHVLVDRLDGDDVTALAAALAGTWLIAHGMSLLWRSRRTGGSPGRRMLVRTGRGLAAIVVIWLVVIPVAMAILTTHKARSPVEEANLGAPHDRVTFTTRDGLRLAGWYVPSRNGAAVIAFPGRTGTVPYARMLVRHGYGVLLLDRRGEGESEGDVNLYGWDGADDLHAAVTYLRNRPDVDPDRIGGLGVSVGGELLLATAAEDRRLRAVVSEGAGVRSLAEHLHTPGLGPLQRWLSPWVAQTAAVGVLSNTMPPDDLVDLAGRIGSRPVLLIQALHGVGGEELNPVYRDAIGPTATLWQVADGGHTGALAANPDAYERRVVGFFDRALR